MKTIANVLMLDMRSEEGRCSVSCDLSSLSRAERIFLFGLLQGAEDGSNISFGVGSGPDERTKIIQFVLDNPLAPSVSGNVSRILAS